MTADATESNAFMLCQKTLEFILPLKAQFGKAACYDYVHNWNDHLADCLATFRAATRNY